MNEKLSSEMTILLWINFVSSKFYNLGFDKILWAGTYRMKLVGWRQTNIFVNPAQEQVFLRFFFVFRFLLFERIYITLFVWMQLYHQFRTKWMEGHRESVSDAGRFLKTQQFPWKLPVVITNNAGLHIGFYVDWACQE